MVFLPKHRTEPKQCQYLMLNVLCELFIMHLSSETVNPEQEFNTISMKVKGTSDLEERLNGFLFYSYRNKRKVLV